MPKVFNANELEFKQKQIPVEDFAWKISGNLSELVGSKKMHFNYVSLEKGEFSYPFHYHRNTEELFVVISGCAILRSPEGFKKVKHGDTIFMEMGETGAHQLYNYMDEPCIYLDIRIKADIDIVDYPDSNKVNILPYMEIYKKETKVGYFEDEKDVRRFWPENVLMGNI